MSKGNFYAGSRWRKVRLAVMERDGWVCQIQAPGCTKVATQADHIYPVLAGGARLDPDNLRAACSKCNQGRKVSRGSRNWMTGKTSITLVVGPEPRGGTSAKNKGGDVLAYVRGHASPDDLIVDEGWLARSVGGSEAAQAMRSMLIGKLARAELSVARAWITSHDPHAEAMLPHHRLVKLKGQGGVAEGSDDVASSDVEPDGDHDDDRPSRAW